VQNIEDKLDTLIVSFKEFRAEYKKDQQIQEQQINDRLKEMDLKFSAKWVEKAMITIITSVGLVIIGALMSLILL